MKKIDFNAPLVTLDGRPMVSEGNSVLIKTIIANTLCLTKPKKGEHVVRQLDLALKIHRSTEPIDIDEVDITIIRDAMMQSESATLVVGQILKLLE